jgi:hypothetical protein
MCSCEEAVDDSILNIIATFCKKIQLLDISECRSINSHFQLRFEVVHFLSEVTGEGIKELTRVQNLEFLFLSSMNIDDEAISSVATGSSRGIKWLNLTGNHVVNPTG